MLSHKPDYAHNLSIQVPVIAGLESDARLSTTFFSPMPVPLRGLCYSLNLRSIFIDLVPDFLMGG